MSDVVIASAVRTPIGRLLGSLESFRAPQLGAIAIKGAVERAGIDPGAVQEVIMGNVITAGLGQNPARQASIYSGVPDSVSAFTINKVCGSGLKAVALAAQAIRAGDIEIAVAGGMESMSNAPFLLPQLRRGHKLGAGNFVDAMVFDGLWDIYNDYHMGNTGELVAEHYGITREDQDIFAFNSHQKAVKAIEEGKFKEEILPVEVPQRKKDPIIFDTDEGPRKDTTAEALARLKAVFKREGSVTAGNASTINDGGSALVVMSEKRAEKEGVKPIARILGYATGAVEPKWVMIAPLTAIKNLNEKIGLTTEDYELIELNEAFSAAAVNLVRELKVDPEKVNVHGGAVALGHPIGCTGARILTTLIYALKDRGCKRGLAALCLGGGDAVALAVEML